MIKLSILICHLNERKDLLARLMAALQPQVDAANGDVEVLVESDNGEISVGAKRNILLDRAAGGMVCYVDDDDMVSNQYVSKIIAAIDSDPSVDAIGMEGLIYNASPAKRFIHSVKNQSWFERDGAYYRSINHLNPVRRELALMVKFPDSRHGEDHDFSTRLAPLLKTEVFIEGNPIYHYFP